MFLSKQFKKKKSFQQLHVHHPVGSQDRSTLKKDSSNIRNAISWLSQFVPMSYWGKKNYIYRLKHNFYGSLMEHFA